MMNKFLKAGIASTLLIFCGSAVTAKSSLLPSSKANDQLGESRIVGGEEAIPENWPWMTAYVFTFEGLATSLTVNDVIYETNSFTSGAAGQASSQIINCGIGDAVCADATGNVCLIERGDINFSEKADNCEAGGGIGAIIYNNEEIGNISGTLGDDYTGTIPVVAITREDGLVLLEQLGSVASLSVSETIELQQDPTCGASFLGDKWVLTAAHCVEDGNPFGFKMNVGEYDLSDGAENAIDIANIYVHRLYDDEAFDNDIAIIELVSSVDIPGIQIAEPDVTDQYAVENSIATVAGWGGRVGYAPDDGPTSDFPDILHRVDLQLMTNQQCLDTFNEDPELFFRDTFVTDNMICAAIPGGGKGSCQGDSGGPLIINTGSGPQQVGIVSFGRGCAAAINPGVYTRVSVYKEWMSAITNGVAVSQRQDFGLGLEGEEQTAELRVTNNSDINVGLTFGLSGSSDFTLDTSNCASLDAGSSCQLSVNYLPESANENSAELIITSDNNQVPTSSAIITGTTLSAAAELSAAAGNTSNVVTLFSGGANGASGWTGNSIEGLESGTSGDLQDSILIAQIEGEGVLTFDWSVSSELNTDLEETDPDFEHYDALYLYLNGELIDSISGEIAFSEMEIDLAEGTNIINWTYNKDTNAADGQDKGFVRNLVFTPVVVAQPTTPAPSQPVTSNSSGGGSVTWLILGLASLTFRLKRKP